MTPYTALALTADTYKRVLDRIEVLNAKVRAHGAWSLTDDELRERFQMANYAKHFDAEFLAAIPATPTLN
jgi:hypothetical protein